MALVQEHFQEDVGIEQVYRWSFPVLERLVLKGNGVVLGTQGFQGAAPVQLWRLMWNLVHVFLGDELGEILDFPLEVRGHFFDEFSNTHGM